MIPKDFKAKRPLYLRLEEVTRPLLKQLATEKGVNVALIESRVKDQNSLEEKITRPDKEGRYSTLEDITDLCGLRIVLYTDEDCRIMTEAIQNHFDIDDRNSTIKGGEHEEDRFGYSSTHLIASLHGERVKLFEFSSLANLKMEIQVRTVLQHAWAVLDWKLRYKTEKEIPKELRRRLYRVSALLEAADDTFSDLLKTTELLRAEYHSEIKQGKLEIPINKDSLQSFLLQSSTVKSIIERCEKRQIQIWPDPHAPDTAYDYLIRSLMASGITTLGQFEQRLSSVTDENIEHLVAIAKDSQNLFGVFTPLRILIISQLEPEQRRQVVTSVSTDLGSISSAERRHFGVDS